MEHFTAHRLRIVADAFALSEPMMMDVKFGRPRRFHKLTVTGYALVMESIYEFPINVGCKAALFPPPAQARLQDHPRKPFPPYAHTPTHPHFPSVPLSTPPVLCYNPS